MRNQTLFARFVTGAPLQRGDGVVAKAISSSNGTLLKSDPAPGPFSGPRGVVGGSDAPLMRAANSSAGMDLRASAALLKCDSHLIIVGGGAHCAP
jgi:hypothetical protein